MVRMQNLVLEAFVLLFFGQNVVGYTTAAPDIDVLQDGPGEGNEGDDMILIPEQMEMMQQAPRKVIRWSRYRWREVNGFPEVPYRFGDDQVTQSLVKKAIEHWEIHTCLVFPEVNKGYSGYHIIFQRNKDVCSSYVGRAISSGQPINVPVWCENAFGSLVHEIGHAIGFFHEQSRSDRDDYVKINTDNIRTTSLKNFNLVADDNFTVPYDFNSDMHYYERAFQINGHITIATRNPLYQGVIGQRSGLSHMDKLAANRMYNCIAKNLDKCSLDADPCQNYGYMGKDCTCVCPDGTAGTNCEIFNKPYNDVNLSEYTETITTEGIVTSPNYDASSPAGAKYTKLIQAPTCRLICLTFSDFEYRKRSIVNKVSICHYEGLEIRTTNMYNGTWYCGNEISPGRVFNSTTNQMILYAVTNKGGSDAKWAASVTFIRDPSCAPVTPTTTSTTNSTSTTTTAAPIIPSCRSTDYGKGLKGFFSPNFPQKYPNNAICIHESDSSKPAMAILKVVKMKLNRGDKLVIEHPYGPPCIFRGTKKRSFEKKVPAHFRATFTSDSKYNKQGFLVKYKETQGKCHASLDGTTPGSFTSPSYPSKHWKNILCEWKITVSPGKRIHLTIRIRKVTCKKNYIAVDKTPYDVPTYDPGAIETYCGNKKNIYIKSDTNVISVFYFGYKRDIGFQVKYKEI